ncbi:MULTISPECIES: hypothetical protein [unclassified Staphylococcus]|uniref:hypothetical protein n=1 Tax=unclassified Staphylococcus TaxID=91994 RepID=UPI001AEC6929|nr:MULTISPECIES: hypothetical protein [unclassified Staphylococcus]
MDVTCNIGFTDGTHLSLDGWDEILFIKEVPYVDASYTGYNLQNDEDSYYQAMNNLTEYPFIGIKRHDNSDELDFAGKKYVFSNHQPTIDKTFENNDILYVQSSAISTIAVYDQW